MLRSRAARTTGVLAALATTAVFVAGCGGDDDASPTTVDDAGAASETTAEESTDDTVVIPDGVDANEVDVSFAQGMIPHHAQAVEMSRLAATNDASPEVAALAAEIEGAQQPEIDLMTQWLSEWGQPAPDPSMDMDGMHEMAGGMMMSGMVSSADMERLQEARGAEFDRLFLEFMILHHEGAIDMARQELEGGQNPAARELAQSIIDSQQAEIDRMNQLLDAG